MGDHDKRVIIYPSYINKKLKISEGRRIPVTKACEDPTAQEIFDSVTRDLKLQAELEAIHTLWNLAAAAAAHPFSLYP